MKAFIYALLLIASASAHALDNDIDLGQLSHEAWRAVERAPTQVRAFAQGADGALWIASSVGLYSFDGVTFYEHPRMPMPSTDATAVLAAKDGTLWAGYRSGVVSVTTRYGEYQDFGPAGGLPGGAIRNILQDPKGRIWVVSAQGVAVRDGARWRRVDTAGLSIGNGFVLGGLASRDGQIWVVTSDGLFHLTPDEQHWTEAFPLHLEGETQRYFAQAPDGAVWLSDSHYGLLNVARTLPGAIHWMSIGECGGPLMFDREGTLWVGGARLRRITLAGQTATIDATEPEEELSGPTVQALFEDHEGNVWVGTNVGVDRFRHADVVWIRAPQIGTDKVIVPGAGDSVWVADGQGSLFRFEHGKLSERSSVPRFTAGVRDRQGEVWFGGTQGVGHMDATNHLTLTPAPPDSFGANVLAMARDGAGALWVSIEGRGLFRLAQGRWDAIADPALPHEAPLVATEDSQGNLWLGYTDDRLAHVARGSIRVFSGADGLHVGNVTALYEKDGHLWIGGERALSFFDGGRFTTVRAKSCQPFFAVTGIVETARGELWVFRNRALSRVIDIARQLKTLKEISPPLNCESFGSHDSKAPSAQQHQPAPSLLATNDGRLWLAANEGLAWLDPARIQPDSSVPPQVSITGFSDAEGRFRHHPRTYPVNTEQLTIQFSSTAIGQRANTWYRYRLIGLESEWRYTPITDVTYTNLRPGHYRFEVSASNWDKVYGPSVSAELIIPPAFYQTSWFSFLCWMLGLLMLGLTYRLLVRRAAGRLRARLEERIKERERIARELHDTLLQGVQAVVLRFQGVAARIPPHDPARKLMDQTLDLADDVISEGRDRVRDLRDSGTHQSLQTEIARAGQELVQGGAIEFRIVVHGDTRSLHPIVREEAFFITREALANACRHAKPRTVEVDLFYERTELRVSIRDDGAGIDQAVLRAGQREGHWGLVGMRERARKIQGHLEIWSRPGAGTEIELRLPATVAYQNNKSRWGWLPSWHRKAS